MRRRSESLDLFNKHAGMKLDVKVASADALDAVKGKTSRVCPLICDHGFRADGDRCTKITCRAGYEVGDDNTCEKIEVKKPTAKRDEPSATKSRSAQRWKLHRQSHRRPVRSSATPAAAGRFKEDADWNSVHLLVEGPTAAAAAM